VRLLLPVVLFESATASFPLACLENVARRNAAAQIDAPHFALARERTVCFCFEVLIALKETVWPEFVLKRMVVGFAMTLTASNLTLFLAIQQINRIGIVATSEACVELNYPARASVEKPVRLFIIIFK
jgi:hypothetical protein